MSSTYVGNNTKVTMGIFVTIFFFSGVAALGFQVVWAKAFAATIGYEFTAILAVVTAFMAGMALGNALLIQRRHIGPKWYGGLEIAIGSWGLITVALTPLLERFLTSILGRDPNPAFHWTVLFTAVLITLLPATTAMGATLPAAERFLARLEKHHTTGLLYGANTAGGMVGAIAAAFWLMPWLGIRGCLAAFGAISVVCGIAALSIARTGGEKQNVPPKAKATPPRLAIQLLACGLLGIGFEVVIIRALVHVLENTVYTFAIVLAVYLLGNALGAFLFHQKNRRSLLCGIDVLLGLLSAACVVAALTLRWAHSIYLVLRELLGDSLCAVAISEAGTAAAFFFLPALLMGATWAALAQRSLEFKPSLAWGVAINTAGAAVAPLLFALLVIPALGLQSALALIPLGYGLLVTKFRTALASVALAALTLPLNTSVRDLIDTAGGQIISLSEGVMGSVAILENANGTRVLKFNNRFQMGGTAARVAEERQAQIPLLLHEKPQRALFIGLGTGITFATARHFPDVQTDGVELVPEIAAAMPFFNAALIQKSNLHTFIADGRRFVRASEDRYDVIVSDLFHPAQDGAGFLYTVEHFATVRARLSPGGLFCQWLPVYQMDMATLHTVMATFAKVFPHPELWLLRFNVDVPVIGLIARTGSEAFQFDAVESRTKAAGTLGEALKRTGLGDATRLLGCYIGSFEAARDAVINTDLNPILLFRTPELTFKRKDDPGARLLDLIKAFQKDPGRILGEERSEATARLRTFVRARNIYLEGLQHERAGDSDLALGRYIESAELSEEFTAGYAQALTIATALAQQRPEQSRAILQRLVEARPERPVARELLRRMP